VNREKEATTVEFVLVKSLIIQCKIKMDKGLKIGFFTSCILGSVYIAYTSNKIWSSAKVSKEVSFSGSKGQNLDKWSYCTLKSEEFDTSNALDVDYIFMLPRPKVVKHGNESHGLRTFAPKMTLGVVCMDCQDSSQKVSSAADRIKVMVENYSSQLEPIFNQFCTDTSSHSGGVPGYRIFEIDAVTIELQSSLTNESVCITGGYQLHIDHNFAIVRTCSEEGIRHGLSTLSIIIHNQKPFSLPVSIDDWPDMEWRGMLIDVSRHFIPLRKLFRAVDAMSAVKMNVLHLHLTDSQVVLSFMYLSRDRYVIENHL
jgi:hypothetical protein